MGLRVTADGRLHTKVATFALFPNDDPKPAHRIGWYWIAVGTSMLVWVLLFLLSWQGYLEESGLIYATGGMLFFFMLFYAVFRSGLNLRARDPSLTVEMIEASILVLTCAMFYASPEGRGVIVLLLPFTFLFGIVRLDTRELLGVAGFAIICYGLMTLFFLYFRPGTIDLRFTLLRWAVLAAVLVWFALMGGYISRMRKDLALGNSNLENALHTIQDMATHDELTGVHNRRHLMEMLRHEKNRCARTGAMFCVCIIDLDFFKQINDRYGHQAGDDVLRSFSQSTVERMRTCDYFGRYGGEEFLLILTHTNSDGAQIAADRLRSEAEKLRFSNISPELKLTVSIGLAQHQPGEEIEQMLKCADDALYRAKEAGRNRVEM